MTDDTCCALDTLKRGRRPVGHQIRKTPSQKNFQKGVDLSRHPGYIGSHGAEPTVRQDKGSQAMP